MFKIVWLLVGIVVAGAPSVQSARAPDGRELDGHSLDETLRTFEFGSLRLSVPESWRTREMTAADPLYLAEVSDLLVPRWRERPVMTTVFLVEQPGDSLGMVLDAKAWSLFSGVEFQP